MTPLQLQLYMDVLARDYDKVNSMGALFFRSSCFCFSCCFFFACCACSPVDSHLLDCSAACWHS